MLSFWSDFIVFMEQKFYYLFFFISTSIGVIKSLDHTKYTLIKLITHAIFIVGATKFFIQNKKVSSTINIKHDKKCKEYLNVQAELYATGRAVRYLRAELSATVRVVHGPSCQGIVAGVELGLPVWFQF